MGRSKSMQVVALLLLLFRFCTEAKYMKYKDPKQPIKVRVKDLMDRMTLEEKIGQMTTIDRANLASSADIITKHRIGSVFSATLPGSVPGPRASAETWIDMINEFQNAALSTRLKIPILYGIDAVHGHSTVYNTTIFPHNVGIGVTRDPELVKKIGAATALEVRATGISYNFAPSIAVCRDPRWGRCFESYSEDHRIVQAMTEIITGLQGDAPNNYPNSFPYVNGSSRAKVAACAKHFVGDGGTFLGQDEGNTIIDWKELIDIHMPAYIDSIRKNVATVMISYSSINGKKMHANYNLITGYLKGKHNFKGIVVSDSHGLDRITTPEDANYTYSVETGINAGIDMVLVPDNCREFTNELTLLVKKHFVPVSRIDDAVQRILRVKFMLGLFENPIADYSLIKHLGSPEHRELAREAVRRSLVLLKNGKTGDEPLLPLPKRTAKILVAGTHANDIGNQCGGWTIEWHGQSGNITVGTTILSAVENTIDPLTEVIYEENPNPEFVKSNNFSYAVVVVGELPYSEFVGDSRNLTIAEPGYKTITSVCESVKCVVVIISGRPVVIEPYLDRIDALVAAWLPGTEGQGVADVLFGDYGFTGKLARTWFRTVDQLPMNVGDSHYDPLFAFGFGLETEPKEMRASQ